MTQRMIGSNDIRLGISFTKYYELRRWYEFLPLGGKESQYNLNYLDWHRSCTRQLLVGATNCLQDVSPNLRGLVLGGATPSTCDGVTAKSFSNCVVANQRPICSPDRASLSLLEIKWPQRSWPHAPNGNTFSPSTLLLLAFFPFAALGR
ncbi:hypothetical protein AFLA_003854 [Aspergillus flavus NRRL3357]|nr:hypothetical protein AFLA_003854 [Aspergillus flavus NRRL3357]